MYDKLPFKIVGEKCQEQNPSQLKWNGILLKWWDISRVWKSNKIPALGTIQGLLNIFPCLSFLGTRRIFN